MLRNSNQTIKATFILFSLLLPVAGQPRIITGKVVSVSDGDKITVLDEQKRQHKVRLDGIDAPESNQDFGSRAKQSLSDLVFGKSVTVIGNKTDRDGRTVGKVTCDGKNVNLEQIRGGFAWFYRAHSHELALEDATAYAQAETQARIEKRGLWTDPSPTPPWNFRRGKTAKASGAKPKAPAKASGAKPKAPPSKGGIIGNRNNKSYHLSNCPDYNKVSARNRVPFKTEAKARAAGYRKARNCPR